MVRVLAIADEIAPGLTAARVHELRPDVLLAAGDLPWDHLEHVAEWAGVPAAYVPGNHDPLPTSERPGPRGLVDLDGHVAVVGALTVAGLGGSVRYNDGRHQHTQDQFHEVAERVLAGARSIGPVDVLLTHAPPSGLGDQPDPAHVGIDALHGVIAALEPTWHLHGHIHPYGMHKPDRQVGPTTLRNVIPWQLIEVTPRGREV